MKQLDVIILTNTYDDKIYMMTKNAIDSLRKSSESDAFNIILVESNKEKRHYDVDVYLKPEQEFNYNTYLNIAIENCTSDFTCISNNDVFFHKNWWEKLHSAMLDYNLDTASPKSPIEQKGIVQRAELKHRFTPLNKVVEGHHVVYTFCGWCWVMKKDIRDWLFPLDEQFSFFYQDNDIILRLQERNCKHALVGGSLVDHYGQSSHKILHEQGTYMQHTFNLEKKFLEKWKTKLP